MCLKKTEDYEDLWGMSCIENQVLAILRANDIPIVPLYQGTNLPLSVLWDCFLVQKMQYANFDGIPRIQDVLKKEKMITLERTIASPTPVWELLQKQKKDTFILLRILPEAAKQQLHVRGWRPDHYVLAMQDNNKIVLYNDIPACRLEITRKDFDLLYGGDYFWLTLHRARLKALSTQKPLPPIGIFQSELELREFATEDMQYLRDMLGVYRMLKKRQRAYYAELFDTTFMDECIKRIDGLYVQIEYYNLKKESRSCVLHPLLEELQKIDFEIQIKLTGEKNESERD